MEAENNQEYELTNEGIETNKKALNEYVRASFVVSAYTWGSSPNARTMPQRHVERARRVPVAFACQRSAKDSLTIMSGGGG